MAVYKLLLNEKDQEKALSPSVAANKQRKAIMEKLNNTRYYSRDMESLEKMLNDFFYYEKNQVTKDKYYDKAIALAEEEFEKAYNEKFVLDPTTLTAKRINKGSISFLKEADFTAEKAIALAKEIELLLGDDISEKAQQIITKIKTAQDLSNWDDVKDINGIVASILYGNKTVYGDAFEYPLAAIAALMKQEVEEVDKDVTEIFNEDTLLGKRKSPHVLNISRISTQDLGNLSIHGSVQVNKGVSLEYTTTAQDKVDVALTFKEQEYNMSAKSYYDTNKEIGLTGGLPLTAPVLNLSSVDFVNQYLTQLYLNGDLQDIHKALRLNILFMSLTGSQTGPKIAANAFVLNDKKRKRIFVRSMKDIVNYIANNDKWEFFKINDRPNGVIPDEPLRGKYNTVASVINEMHKIKLTTSLKGRVIKDSIKQPTS